MAHERQQGPGVARRGLMLVLSSPSGAGKTTLTRRLLERDKDVTLSVSVTTRKMRPGEQDGRDYQFIDRKRCWNGPKCSTIITAHQPSP
jgi:guanylate kinase